MGLRWLLALVLASGLAWSQLDALHTIARAWAVILLVPLPALMIIEARRLNEIGTLPRAQAYISSIISLWVLGLATMAVVAFSDMAEVAELRTALSIDPLGLGFAIVATAGGIAVLFLFRALGVRENALMHQLLPESGRERLLFVGVSVTAGICEELVYRGFLLQALTDATSSAFAVVLSSGAFGVAHAYQSPAGALRATLLGALLCVPVLFTGSLLPSMIAHALIDILSGLWLARYLLRGE